MTSVITGDIVNSKTETTSIWMKTLTKELNLLGKSPKTWEIYRGDSFQIEVEPKHSLAIAIAIKASIKQHKTLDVRLAIGIGEKDYDAKSITESNGSAFVNSGECFERLKKSTLAVQSNNKAFDKTINTMLNLAELIMDSWTPKAAILFRTALKHSEANQQEIADILNRKQSNISAGLKRSGYDEIMQLIDYYQQNITTL
ncbi:SatD family protein [Lacinutrix chionoecetis]